jgi:hypothetical protein
VLERAAFNAIVGFGIIFNLSTGAIPNFPPRVFQLCQAVMLGGFVHDYYFDWQYRSSADYPTLPFTFLFLGKTTLREVALTAGTTRAFFVAKQLLKSIVQPQYSQLLHPRYKIRELPPPSLSQSEPVH